MDKRAHAIVDQRHGTRRAALWSRCAVAIRLAVVALLLVFQSTAQTIAAPTVDIGTIDISGQSVTPPATPSVSASIGAGTVNRITVRVVASAYGISFGDEIRVQVVTPTTSYTVTGSQLGFPANSGTFTGQYSFNVTPESSAGTWTVYLSDSLNDLEDPDYTTGAGSVVTVQYSDQTPPGATITSGVVSPTNSASVPMTVTFTEPVVNFVAGAISVTNGTVSGFSGSGDTYTFNVVPSTDGAVNVNVLSGAAQDDAGNGNTAATQFSFVSDRTGPTVTFSPLPADPTNAARIEFQVIFSEPVNGFDISDFDVTNWSVIGYSVTGDPKVYNFFVNPRTDGLVTVDFSAGKVTDAAGNPNTAAAQLRTTSDRTGPTVVISSTETNPTNVSPVPITVTFSESVTLFDASDLSYTGGTISNFAGSGAVYTFDLTPSGDGVVTVDVGAKTAQDLAGNDNTAATQYAILFDATPPALIISGVPGSYFPGDIFNVTFDFQEDVTGFDATDIVVDGGVVSAFAGGPTVYTATVTPGNVGDVTVTVADAAASDLSGNPSVGASASSAIESAAIASEQIAHFLENRSRALLQSQPGLTRFLSGAGGHSRASISMGAASYDFESDGDGPTWMAFQASHSSTAFETMNYGLVTFGSHVAVGSNTLLGGMIQFDYAEQISDTGIRTAGSGFLVGPYFVSQIEGQPLYFEGRLLYGLTRNQISPLGTFTDAFFGERVLASLGVEGKYDIPGATLFPNLSASYVSDSQYAYTDGLGNFVAAQQVSLTEVVFGLDAEVPLSVAQGNLTLTGGLSGSWSHIEGTGAAVPYIANTQNWDSRIDLGLVYDNGGGIVLSTSAYMTGLAPNSNRTSFGGEIGVEVNF